MNMLIYPQSQDIDVQIQKCHMWICRGQRTRHCKKITLSLASWTFLDCSVEAPRSGGRYQHSHHSTRHFTLWKMKHLLNAMVQQPVYLIIWLQQRPSQGILWVSLSVGDQRLGQKYCFPVSGWSAVALDFLILSCRTDSIQMNTLRKSKPMGIVAR